MSGPERIFALPWAVRAPVNREQLERRRDSRLRSLLSHAHRHVPFIRRLMEDAGVGPDDIRTAVALGRLPVVGKRDYQQACPAQVVADNAARSRLLDRSTSGSTGERMLVKRTWFEERLLNAFRWRALHTYGHGPGDRLAVMDFRAGEDRRDNQAWMRLAQSLGLCRRQVFDGLSDPRVAGAVAKFDPHVVSGMTSAIARLADDVASGPHRIRPRFIATGGELLTEPLRARIAAFGVPIHDLYGCNELNLVAWQCPNGAGTYHVCDDAHIIEVLGPEDRPVAVGAWGQVVATSLFSYAMPFIRYRLGDDAVRGPDRCPCGAAFSTLLAIRGRTIDCFVLSDGRVIHPWEIINAIKPHLHWIRQFQLIQYTRDHIGFRIVPNGLPTVDDTGRLRIVACAALDGRATLSLKIVSVIEPGPSGKSRPFVPFAG